LISKLNINKASFLVIACRGHLEDHETLVEALKTGVGYIGMLGSRKKVKTVFANLVQQGIPEDNLRRVHAPVGIPISTDTPEEIAISIVAEIIDARRQNKKWKPPRQFFQCRVIKTSPTESALNSKRTPIEFCLPSQ
jgi:xanthine dehydrogenase accessory factor